MNTNLVADTLYNALVVKHARVYRNEPPKNPVFPYVVFNVESITDTYPSDDYYVYIDVFDKPSASVRAMETLADDIQSLARTVIYTSDISMQIEKISRQFVSNSDLVVSKMITMQFECRVYF